tara:strand:- start:55242 stop:56006 length:765 start_codon:yes stop_codon:yes gene_type:complete
MRSYNSTFFLFLKKAKHYFCIALLAGLLLGCSDKTPSSPEVTLNKIMPLGASRVQGASPIFESYRYELWKLLVNGGWEFDFIGTRMDNFQYEIYSSLTFDNNHEGRSGWTSTQILNGISDWLNEAGSPDIVLFSSPGGNDIINSTSTYPEVLANINEIIDIIQESNPDVTIIIELLAPGKTFFMTDELTIAFNDIHRDVLTIAAEQTTATSLVATVDMYTGFDDSHLADVIHYNEKGALFIATRYYDVLDDILE